MGKPCKIISYLLIITFFISIVPAAVRADEISKDKEPGSYAVNIPLQEPSADVDISSAESEKKAPKPHVNTVTTKQYFDKEDYLYGHSSYYKELKKAGRLDLIRERIEQEPQVKQLESPKITEQKLAEELGGSFIQAMNTLSSTKSYYNTLVGPSAMNNLNNTQYSAHKDFEEFISPETGDLTLKITDLSLAGRNGLDLKLTRIYQSNQSHSGDKKVSSDVTRAYEDYSTYYNNRYNMGIGWTFGFPSVQIEEDAEQKVLYYHMGDGTVYKVEFTADTTDSNLEKYYKKDAVFDNDTSYSNGQVNSAYVFKTADQTKRYFGGDGRLLGIVDRFGNKIEFEHVERPVSNRSPNNDFEFPENVGVWTTNSYYSYDGNWGKDDNTSYKYYYSSPVTASGMSNYLEALPNTKYYLGGYINDQLTAGTASLTYREYDQYYNQIYQGALNTAAVKNDWQHVEQYFTTHDNTRFIRIEFRNTGAQGSSWVDKVRFDRAWPLISTITDTIGREVDFSYTDNLYEESPEDSVTITVSSPDASDSITLVYDKGYYYCEADCYFSESVKWTENRKCQFLYAYSNGTDSQRYSWTIYPLDSQDAENYSFFSKPPTEHVATSRSVLISDIVMRNMMTEYEYAKKSNHMGEDGFLETHRVAQRSERTYSADGWLGEQYRQQYSYSGVCGNRTFNNETGFPFTDISPQDSAFYFTCAMNQENGLEIEQQLKGGSIGLRNNMTRSAITSGEEKITYFDAYDTNFPDQPTVIRTAEVTPGAGTRILYTGYSYNDWGGTAAETNPLTESQWTNSTARQKHTTSYTYHPSYKFLASKTYYQDENTQLSMSNSYDSLGRLTSNTDEKGQVTEFSYQDGSHPGNLTKTNIDLAGGKSSTVAYGYNDPYNTYAYPTSITQHYTQSGSPRTSTTSIRYEYLFGNTVSQEDGQGNQTSYQYDDVGRLIKTTYPSSEGRDGIYTVEDNYSYSMHIQPSQLGFAAYRVSSFRNITEGGDTWTVSLQYGYYDDYGNLLLNRRYNIETGSYMEDKYSLNNYRQLLSHENDQGNTTGYVWDEWNRIRSVTDAQSNQQLYAYNSYDRTKTTYFVPQDTGTAENHYTETYDQWGRTISKKAYPAGINQTPVETTFAYDMVNNLVAEIDGRGNETAYRYDQLNRLVKATDALGQEADYEYNRLGNIAETVQYEGTQPFITVKDYDERGLLTSQTEPGGEITAYTCNANGLPVSITDASGKTTAMTYDGINRLRQIAVGSEQIGYYYNYLGGVEKYDTNGEDLYYNYYSTGLPSLRHLQYYSVKFAYDTLGNRTQIQDPANLAVNYQYDSLSRLTDVAVDNRNFTYEYYGDGMIKAVNYPNGLRSEYNYDNMNRLVNVNNKLNGSPISQFAYAYDQNSNIISATADGQTTTYEYDELNRLTGIYRPGGEVIEYGYDSRGNRIQATVCEIDPSVFVPCSFDYNPWDEMSEYTVGQDIYSYEYDPEGIRSLKLTPDANSTRYHCDDNGLVITESDQNNVVTAQNIWGHRALARKVSGSYYYYVYNGHGDVIQVLDESGDQVNTYQYDEWGNILSCSEQIENPIRYAGEYYDQESGLYYLRARYYDPVAGRFISQDSLEGDITNPLTLNQYIYCADNPLAYVDSEGKFFFVPVAYAAAAAISAGLVTAGAAKTADAISGQNNSGRIYQETARYLASDEAQRAYGQTGLAVATTGLARFTYGGGFSYMESLLERFLGTKTIRKVIDKAEHWGYKNLDKITSAQKIAKDLSENPGAPKTAIGFAKTAYGALNRYIEPAVNYVQETTPKVINRAKETALQVKSAVESKLNKAQVFIQEKTGQAGAYVKKQAQSVQEKLKSAGESASGWFRSLR